VADVLRLRLDSDGGEPKQKDTTAPERAMEYPHEKLPQFAEHQEHLFEGDTDLSS
jgi:hypothetical protein